MPHIPTDARPKFDEIISQLPQMEHAGDLHYVISEIFIDYLIKNGVSYQTINDVIGVSLAFALYFGFRTLIPYERMKRGDAGDTSFAKLDKILQDRGCEITP